MVDDDDDGALSDFEMIFFLFVRITHDEDGDLDEDEMEESETGTDAILCNATFLLM